MNVQLTEEPPDDLTSIRMSQIPVTDTMVNNSLEIISLLTGETFAAVKSNDLVAIMAPQHPLLIPERRIGKQQLLQMIKKLVEQLMGKTGNPSQCNSAVKQENGEDGDMKGSQHSQHRGTRIQDQPLLISPDGSYRRTPRPLCSRDSTQEDHTCHDQSEDHNSRKVECIKQEEISVRDDHGSMEDAGRMVTINKEEEEISVRDDHGSMEEAGRMVTVKKEKEEISGRESPKSIKADWMVDVKLEESSTDEDAEYKHKIETSVKEHRSRSSGFRWEDSDESSEGEDGRRVEYKVKKKNMKGVEDARHPAEEVTNNTGLGQETSSGSDLNRHQQSHAKNKPFTCPECGKGFSDRCYLGTHMRLHKGHKNECPECGKTFSAKGNLSTHMKLHRGHKHECPECGKCYTQAHNLKKHIRRHTGERPYSCSECGKTFSEKCHVRRHLQIHQGHRYECPECGKTFSAKRNLSTHMKHHRGPQKNECPECGKCYSNEYGLREHLRLHTGEEPYSCPECGKTFSGKGRLNRHIQLHTGQRHECPECGKTFTAKANLSTHMKLHGGPNNYLSIYLYPYT